MLISGKSFRGSRHPTGYSDIKVFHRKTSFESHIETGMRASWVEPLISHIASAGNACPEAEVNLASFAGMMMRPAKLLRVCRNARPLEYKR